MGHAVLPLDDPALCLQRLPMDELSPMAIAFEEAEAAFQRGEVPVGAVAVDSSSGAIIARAGNRVEELGDPMAHAELLVLQQAVTKLNEKHIDDVDLYVTLEPCPMCAGAISLARIRRLYFAAYDSKTGGVDHGPKVFDHSTCHHKPDVIGGIDEARASALLKRFFAERR